MVIMQAQAYRQRWVTGAQSLKGSGKNKSLTFDPGANMVWAVVDAGAKFGDFDQADLEPILRAEDSDVGNFSAITQTPVSYLSNKLVNVSGETLTAAQASLVSKVKTRMEVMGWFFEQIIKLCFAYQGDSTRATDIEAETLWIDPEMRTMAEVADMMSKFVTASPAMLPFAAEKAGMTPEEVDHLMEQHEEMTAKEQQAQMDLAKASIAQPGAGAGKPGASKTASKAPASKASAKKPAGKSNR
jgi:hypothetical protein